ncbi:unnamed protein product [Heligmosomoides polygyrus]|uniref:Transmembrane protein n=1 Tax=Heligmosomoides polygyrus TaxID=6339 RepID=A0A183FJL2_HELPZ|nr:unnamed protein product [Heligmosomoides polygyrus]
MDDDRRRNGSNRTLQYPANLHINPQFEHRPPDVVLKSLLSSMRASMSAHERSQSERRSLGSLLRTVLLLVFFVLLFFIGVFEIIVGAIGVGRCPVQPMIPVWLLISGLMNLFRNAFGVACTMKTRGARQRQRSVTATLSHSERQRATSVVRSAPNQQQRQLNDRYRSIDSSIGCNSFDPRSPMRFVPPVERASRVLPWNGDGLQSD